MRHWSLGITLFFFLACRSNPEGDWGDPSLSLAAGGAPPGARADGGIDGGTSSDGGVGTSLAELLALVTSGGYQGWRRDPGVHPSAGPHVASGRVRIFMNDALADSQSSNPHAAGSIAVMELYDNPGIEVVGHAISAKVDGGWNFVRGFRPSYSLLDLDSSVPGVGMLHPCAGCHLGAVDFVWSRLP